MRVPACRGGHEARARSTRHLAWQIFLPALLSTTINAAIPGVDLSPEEWAEEVRRHGVDPSLIVNPLEYTAEMQAFARETDAYAAGIHDRLDHLQRRLFFKHQAPFDYDPNGTLTATEAFETRRGNCVAFTNLFIAMARSIGIPVQPALIGRRGELEEDGDLVVVNNHVVAVYRHSAGLTIFDFYRTREEELDNLIPIDDLWAASIYLNNLGVRALRDGNVVLALERLERAVRLAPRYAAVYGNLGVARRRAGDPDGALDAYILGMHIDRRNQTLSNNVYALLVELAQDDPGRAPGQTSAARELRQRAVEALAERRIKRARRLFRRAWHVDRADPEPLVAVARCELILGRLFGARRALRDALEVDPGHEGARGLLDALERATTQT